MDHKLQNNYSSKKGLSILIFPFFILFSLSISACTDLTALILSPGNSKVEIKEGETISFKGEASGGISFSDESDNSYYGYYWYTGGSPSTSSGKEVEVTYNHVGVYSVNFTVTDKEGDRDSVSIQVTVLPGDLTAEIVSPDSSETDIQAGDSIYFEGDASGGTEPYEYYWVTGGDPNTSSGQYPVVTYNEAGVYSVTLTVTGKEGYRDTASIQVTVLPNDLTAEIVSPDSSETDIQTGDSIYFEGDASGGTEPYEYYWVTGGDPDTSSEQYPNVTYNEVGVYSVTLTVTDNGDYTDTDAVTVTVTDSVGTDTT